MKHFQKNLYCLNDKSDIYMTKIEKIKTCFTQSYIHLQHVFLKIWYLCKKYNAKNI